MKTKLQVVGGTTTDPLVQALAERDEALQRLAELRAEFEALKLELRQHSEPVPPLYPTGVHPAHEPPLRYRMVDGVHRVMKGLLRLRRE